MLFCPIQMLEKLLSVYGVGIKNYSAFLSKLVLEPWCCEGELR